jgi:hypothetical protein
MSPEPEAATTMQAQDTSMSPEPEDPGTPQGQDPTLLPEPYPAYDELPPLPARYAHLFPDEMALQVQDQPSPTETALCTTMESLGTSQASQQKIKLLEAENTHQKERCANLETDFKDLKIQYTSLEKARATMQLVLKNELTGEIEPNPANLKKIEKRINEATALAEETFALKNETEDFLREAQIDLNRYREYERTMGTQHTLTRRNPYTDMVTTEVLSGPEYLQRLRQLTEGVDQQIRARRIENMNLVHNQSISLMQINAENELQRVNFEHHAKAVDQMRAALLQTTEMEPKLRAKLQLIVDGVPPFHQQQLDQELKELLATTEIQRKKPPKFIGPICPFWIMELRVRQRLRPYQTTGMLAIFLKTHDHGYMYKTKYSN